MNKAQTKQRTNKTMITRKKEPRLAALLAWSTSELQNTIEDTKHENFTRI